MLRNTVGGSEKSMKLFRFPTTDIEPGCEHDQDDSLWANFHIRKALTDYNWRTKASMP